MLFQFHWQDSSPPNESRLVEEIEVTATANPDSLHAWAREVYDRRKAECPEFWGPMLRLVEDEADVPISVKG
jgi:hypothetical protein